MPTYVYKAKDGPGRTLEGELSAESRLAALAGIDAMGYSPVSVHEKSESRGGRIARARGIKQRDVTVFTRQLASLLKAGVPILKALATAGEQTENKAFARIIEDVENITRDGKMVSDAFSKYPQLFPELYINMVRSGESAGVLDTILFRLADAREKEEESARKVQAALAYPALIIVVGIVTVFVLLTFFLPRVLDLFRSYKHGKLPLPTRILMHLSDLFSRDWYWMLLIAILLWAIYKRMTSIDKGRILVDGIKLRVPLMGRFIRQAEIARFARTLSLLLNSGISIDRALSFSSGTLHNTVLRAEVDEVRRETIQQGMPFSVGLKRKAHFPPLVANMIAVGEQSGSIDSSLDEIASFYEKEVEQHGRMMTSLLEPILILVVGAVVGFIVSAMLLPIFDLSTSF